MMDGKVTTDKHIRWVDWENLIYVRTVHNEEEGDWQRKRKYNTEWSKASQKYKHEPAEFSREKSRAEGSPSFT